MSFKKQKVLSPRFQQTEGITDFKANFNKVEEVPAVK